LRQIIIFAQNPAWEAHIDHSGVRSAHQDKFMAMPMEQLIGDNKKINNAINNQGKSYKRKETATKAK